MGKEDVEKDKINNLKDSQKTIQDLLSKDMNIVLNDNELKKNDIDSMKTHNQHFNDLLKYYVENSSSNLKSKAFLKKVFFWVCMFIMFSITALLIGVTICGLIGIIPKENLIISLTANVLTFFTSFIILPQTIANYLFNNEEEKNMVEIIKSIQDYDKEIRNKLSH